MDQWLSNSVNECMSKQMKMIIVYILLELPRKIYLLELHSRLFSFNSGMNDLLLIKSYKILGEKPYINVKYYFIHCDF